jgi:hypothetical protein
MEPPWEKMMAYVDDELSPADRAALEVLLQQHPEWRTQVAEMVELVGATKVLKRRPPDPQVWDNYWEEIDAKLPRQVGWTLTLIGGMILIGYGIWKVVAFTDNDYVRLGITLVIVGFGLLFAAVIRGRMLELHRDRYRRIQR